MIQPEWLPRNDLAANLRHTGRRIGECVDLSWDCLRNVAPNRGAIPVPLGKFKTQRRVPVDSWVWELVHPLRFFRSWDPWPPDGHRRARPQGKNAWIGPLRFSLHPACAVAGIPTRIVPHPLRHPYARERIRSGLTLPAVRKLLGHKDPGKTIRYVEVASTDLHRQVHLVRAQPRHLVPTPKAPTLTPRAGWDGVADSILFAQHAVEMFRRALPDSPSRYCLDRLSNRLTKILSEAPKLRPP